MKLFRTSFTMVLLTTLLTACTSGPQVRSDFDHSANFASYKTFAFVSPLGTDVDGYSTHHAAPEIRDAARNGGARIPLHRERS